LDGDKYLVCWDADIVQCLRERDPAPSYGADEARCGRLATSSRRREQRLLHMCMHMSTGENRC